MNKKALAIMLTAALAAAQTVTVFGAKSPDTVISIGGSGTGGGSSKPAEQTPDETPTKTADGQSLATNGAGSKTENVKAEFATGGASTAGLPEQVVSTINSINSGTDLKTATGKEELAGYAALTKTSAVVLTDTTTNAAASKASTVTLYIPNLISNLQNVKILYFENATGLWKVLDPTAIDFNNKTITFEMLGSGTVTVIHK